MNDAALARALASAAGKLLLRLQTDAGPRSEATADKALGDAGDRRANVLILDALRRELGQLESARSAERRRAAAFAAADHNSARCGCPRAPHRPWPVRGACSAF